MDANNKKLFDRISSVNSIIASNDTAEPPLQFSLKHAKENIKNSDTTCYFLVVCTAPLIMRTLSGAQGSSAFRLIVLGTAILLIILNMINTTVMKKKILAEVNGDSITINRKTYHHSEISEIRKAALNNLKIVSEGNTVVTVNKSCDGCAELIQWAKYYGIRINDDGKKSSGPVQNRQYVLIAVWVGVAIAAALIIFFLKKALHYI